MVCYDDAFSECGRGQLWTGTLLSGIVPVIAGLINEGMEQGICQTDYSEEAAEMTFLYANMVFDDLTEHSGEERKIEAFIYNLERLLNQKQGSMKSVIMPFFKITADKTAIGDILVPFLLDLY